MRIEIHQELTNYNLPRGAKTPPFAFFVYPVALGDLSASEMVPGRLYGLPRSIPKDRVAHLAEVQ